MSKKIRRRARKPDLVVLFVEHFRISSHTSRRVIRCFAKGMSVRNAAVAANVSRPLVREAFGEIRFVLNWYGYYKGPSRYDYRAHTRSKKIAFRTHWQKEIKSRNLSELIKHQKDESIRDELRYHKYEVAHRFAFSDLSWETAQVHTKPSVKSGLTYYEHALAEDIIQILRIRGPFDEPHLENDEVLFRYCEDRWKEFWSHYYNVGGWYYRWNPVDQEEELATLSRKRRKLGADLDSTGTRRSRLPK
jgi:hypothetical protein